MSTPAAESVNRSVFNVQVAGLPLKVRSSHDAKIVDELVQIVDQKVKEAMQTNATVSFQNALVLASLNLAEELVLLKQTLFSGLDRVETRSREILDRLDDVVPKIDA